MTDRVAGDPVSEQSSLVTREDALIDWTLYGSKYAAEVGPWVRGWVNFTLLEIDGQTGRRRRISTSLSPDAATALRDALTEALDGK